MTSIGTSRAAYTPPPGSTALSDGSYLYTYEVPADDLGRPLSNAAYLAHVGAGGQQIGYPVLLGLDDFYGSSVSYTTKALAGGRFAVLSQARDAFQPDAPTTTVTLVTGGSAGFDLIVPVVTYTGSSGTPLPSLITTDPVLTVLPNGTLTVGYTAYYTPTNPDYPDFPAPSGTQTYLNQYDQRGHLLSTVFVDFNGDRTDDRYTASGSLASEVHRHDGIVETTVYGITGKAYATQVSVVDAAGKLVSDVRTDAAGNLVFSNIRGSDGTYQTRSIAANGNETDTHVTATGKLIDSHSYDAAARPISDTVANADGSVTTRTFDLATLKPVFTSVRNTDGSHADISIVTGRPYAEQDSFVDAKGHLVEIVRKYANGSIYSTEEFGTQGKQEQIDSFDTLARKTTTIAVAADGSRDVTQRQYAGTSTIPNAITTTHYDAAGHVSNAAPLVDLVAHQQDAMHLLAAVPHYG